MKGIFFAAKDSRLDYVFSDGRKEIFMEEIDMLDEPIDKSNLEKYKTFLQQTEIAVGTWGIPVLTSEQIENYFPKLRLLLYAAGSVQYFARPYLERGIHVVSAWGFMSIPVAEYTVSAILHANKGFYHSHMLYQKMGWDKARWKIFLEYPGTYHTKIGILGAGMIGSKVIKLLRSHDVEILVYDPFLSEERAKYLGAKISTLEEIFSTCQTISNHIADNKDTRGMIGYSLFRRMKKNAAFINTGRGAQIQEDGLIRALKEEPDRIAILDVTDPEPANQKLLCMPNVFLTPHIAGFAVKEVLRMPDGLLEILRDFKEGKPLQYEVTLEMLQTMA